MTRGATFTLCLLLAAIEDSLFACPQSQPQSEQDGAALIFWDDRSESYKKLPYPHTDLALITHGIYLARLSGKSVKVAVIVFNGDGVKVIGDENGMPTS